MILGDGPDLRDLSVVVLSHNRRDELERNLPSLCESSARTGFELIVVDNASTDGSVELITWMAVQHPSMIAVLSSENLGVASGRNKGWTLTSRAYILNLDDDTWIEEADLGNLLVFMAANPTVGIASPKIIHATTSNAQCDYGEASIEIANFHGACHIVRANTFKRIGDIDALCAFGGEELDYSIRARVAGYGVAYAPVATVRHNSKVRARDEGGWRRQQWIFNYVRVLFKHFSIQRALVLAFRLLTSHAISGLKTYGFLFTCSLFFHAARGAGAGRKGHVGIPAAVSRFYANPDLLPEFGNVPIWVKVLPRLRCKST